MYKLTNTQNVVALVPDSIHTPEEVQYIPFDLANTEYQRYLSWLAEGNTPTPYVAPPPPIPSTVTRFQALATLAAGNYLDAVYDYIDTLPRSNITRLAFENATDWERSSPTLAALATMLDLTEEQVDDLFIAADQVSA